MLSGTNNSWPFHLNLHLITTVLDITYLLFHFFIWVFHILFILTFFSPSFLENDLDDLQIFGGPEGIGGNFTPDDDGGAVASWLVSSTPDRAVRIRALAEDIVLCWSHLIPTVPLSTQVYKWASHPGGSRNTPSRLMLLKPG